MAISFSHVNSYIFLFPKFVEWNFTRRHKCWKFVLASLRSPCYMLFFTTISIHLSFLSYKYSLHSITADIAYFPVYIPSSSLFMLPDIPSGSINLSEYIEKKVCISHIGPLCKKRIVAYSIYGCFHDVCILAILDCKNCYNKYNICEVIM